MCNCAIRMCISCTGHTMKTSPCATFDEITKTKNYDDMFDRSWMTEHVKDDPTKVRTNVSFVFCPTCKNLDKPGFKHDVKKVSKAAEKTTCECLGTFTFTYTNGKVINSWIKTDFGKVDPDKYMTTDTEGGEDDSEEEDEDSESDEDGDSDKNVTETAKMSATPNQPKPVDTKPSQ